MSRSFGNEPLGDMLAIGRMTPRSARIWARVDVPGVYELRWIDAVRGGALHRSRIRLDRREADYTGSIEIRDGLEPDRRYRVAMYRLSGEQLATAAFTTAPAPEAALPARFSVAFMSCHEPFDRKGRVNANAEPMLAAAYRAFSHHDVRQVVLGGDQLYADLPQRLSLFDDKHFASVAPDGCRQVLDCSERQVRGLFHERYRHFWGLPGWQRLLSNFPCYPIIDDHEIVDNWGSAEEHSTARWQPFRAGAFAAYRDYQATLVRAPSSDPPPELDYHMELADTATYVMDLRSNRRVGDEPRVFAPRQLEALGRFLHHQRDKRVVFVVLSVPAIHLPRRLSRLVARLTPDGEDFSDRWSSRGHRADRDQLLRLLHSHQAAHPQQRVVLLSGDIHIGCLHRISWRDGTPDLYQFISSGITHDPGTVVQSISGLIMRANRQLSVDGNRGADVVLESGEGRAQRNPCGQLNFGIVEVTRDHPDASPWLTFLLYTHRGAEPVCQYRSPPIPAAEA